MDSLNLLKNTSALWEGLERTVLELKSLDLSELEVARRTLAETDLALRTLKAWAITHQFSSWADEIVFFKTLKPRFVGKFICTSKIISVLLETPAGGTRSMRRKYEQEGAALQQFFEHNRD